MGSESCDGLAGMSCWVSCDGLASSFYAGYPVMEWHPSRVGMGERE